MMFVPPDGADLIEPLPNGSVFQAAIVRSGGALAVCKRLLPRVRREPAARAAIVREATALSRARHPSLPAILRVGADAHGPFVIESRIEGVSLRALLEAWSARGGVPPSLLVHVASAAAGALAEVHALVHEGVELGLSHGDLGPDHVIFGSIGDVRFVDFGAARFEGMDASLETDDHGTLPFTAPEVARGEAVPRQAADVYALAATILWLATGGAPLAAALEGPAMLLEIGERGLALELCDRAEALSFEARNALRRALALDPAMRLARARDLADALAAR